jgi:hypothetical protein
LRSVSYNAICSLGVGVERPIAGSEHGRAAPIAASEGGTSGRDETGAEGFSSGEIVRKRSNTKESRTGVKAITPDPSGRAL